MKAVRAFAVLGLVVCGCVSVDDLAQYADDIRVKTRIGVLGDVEVGDAAGTKSLEKALAFFSQQKVDAVAFVGAITKDGRAGQMAALNRVWKDVFEGSGVKLITDEGRHEVEGFVFETAARRPAKPAETLTFYGNRKLPLTDELCFAPWDGLSVCAGSMRGVDLPQGVQDEGLKKAASRAAQGLLVSCYDDRTVIRRLDFTQALPKDGDLAWRVKKDRLAYAEDVADPWVIEASGVVRSADVAPEFWDDTVIRVLPGFDATGWKNCAVVWPTVLKRFAGARARWYEVGVVFADRPQHQFLRRTALSPGFHLSEDRDLDGATCVFMAEELPLADETHREIVFQVTPIGAFGKAGKTFSSDPLPLRASQSR